MKLRFQLAAMSFLCLMGCSSHQTLEAKSMKVTCYDNGEATVVDEQYHRQILGLAVELAAGAERCPRILVINETIERAKEKTCIEIVFDNEREFRVADGHSLSLRRILIPLTGEKQRGPKISFYWGTKSYASPPYRNSQDVSIIRKLVSIVREGDTNQPSSVGKGM